MRLSFRAACRMIVLLPLVIASAESLHRVATAQAADDGMVILRIEPRQGGNLDSTVVELRGTAFPDLPLVHFGPEPAKVLLVDTSAPIGRIIVLAPPAPDDGTVDVRVEDATDASRYAVSAAADGGGFDYLNSIGVLPYLVGTVRNSATEKSLLGAHVRVSPGNMTAISGEHGAYAVILPSPGDFTVRTYATGFEDASKSTRVPNNATSHLLDLDLVPLHPTPADRDGDGLSDEDELSRGTDPDDPDTDTDGLSDGQEIALGLDPLNFFDADRYRRTDVDGSGVIDAVDLQQTVNAVLLGVGLVFADADIDRNGVVDAIDVQWVVNAILKTP